MTLVRSDEGKLQKATDWFQEKKVVWRPEQAKQELVRLELGEICPWGSACGAGRDPQVKEEVEAAAEGGGGGRGRGEGGWGGAQYPAPLCSPPPCPGGGPG